MAEGRTSLNASLFEKGLLQIWGKRRENTVLEDTGAQVQLKNQLIYTDSVAGTLICCMRRRMSLSGGGTFVFKNSSSLTNAIVKHFPQRAQTKTLAENLFMVQREKPQMPVFHGCPSPSHRKGALGETKTCLQKIWVRRIR